MATHARPCLAFGLAALLGAVAPPALAAPSKTFTFRAPARRQVMRPRVGARPGEKIPTPRYAVDRRASSAIAAAIPLSYPQRDVILSWYRGWEEGLVMSHKDWENQPVDAFAPRLRSMRGVLAQRAGELEGMTTDLRRSAETRRDAKAALRFVRSQLADSEAPARQSLVRRGWFRRFSGRYSAAAALVEDGKLVKDVARAVRTHDRTMLEDAYTRPIHHNRLFSFPPSTVALDLEGAMYHSVAPIFPDGVIEDAAAKMVEGSKMNPKTAAEHELVPHANGIIAQRFLPLITRRPLDEFGYTATAISEGSRPLLRRYGELQKLYRSGPIDAALRETLIEDVVRGAKLLGAVHAARDPLVRDGAFMILFEVLHQSSNLPQHFTRAAMLERLQPPVIDILMRQMPKGQYRTGKLVALAPAARKQKLEAALALLRAHFG